jgi:hypothetical protein
MGYPSAPSSERRAQFRSQEFAAEPPADLVSVNLEPKGDRCKIHALSGVQEVGWLREGGRYDPTVHYQRRRRAAVFSHSTMKKLMSRMCWKPPLQSSSKCHEKDKGIQFLELNVGDGASHLPGWRSERSSPQHHAAKICNGQSKERGGKQIEGKRDLFQASQPTMLERPRLSIGLADTSHYSDRRTANHWPR